MRRVSVALISAASFVAFTHIASAADLYQPAPYKAPPPPPPVQDWSGIYVGIEGGYGWGHDRFDQAFDPFFGKTPVLLQPAPTPSPALADVRFVPFPINDPTISSINQRGWLGGGFAGVQKQWGSLVLGLDAGIDGADIKGSTTATNFQSCTGTPNCHLGGIIAAAALVPVPTTAINISQQQTINSKIDLLGYAGPKVGWALSPSWMIYGTGGLAFAHTEANASQAQTVQQCVGTSCKPFGDFDFSQTQSGGLTAFGWAAGAGIDWKYEIDPGSAVVLGVKYLHYGFGNNTLTLADNQFGSGASFGINTKQDVDTVTGRISYFFSIH
jgi:outer membrane immunogenic protein